MKLLLSLVFIFLTVSAHALEKGFNQAWWKNNYAHQWLDRYYDPAYVDHILKLNRQANSTILRVWLFEGSSLFQFDQVNGSLVVKPEVLKNLRHFLQLAKSHQLKVSLTFLDGNAFQNLQSRPDLLTFWWNVFNDQYGALGSFHRGVLNPVYQVVSEFRGTVTQIDLVNEVNALDFYGFLSNGQSSLSHLLCRMKQGSPVPVTASLGWLDAETRMLTGYLAQSCVDFYSVHYYNDQGVIPGCQEYKKLAAKGVKLQLGEFGQSSLSFDDDLQKTITQNFLKSAKECGFFSALAWRLEDYRSGPNSEARFSYMAYGKPRPALEVFRRFNSK